MPNASYFRLKARQCRELADIALKPEVQEQLRLFAEEFEAQAETLELPPLSSKADRNP